MSNTTIKKNASKIIIMGIDNSGKSSILLSLREDTNLMNFVELHPTKGIDIQTFGTDKSEISCWDFSGQEQYRKSHLKNLSKNLGSTNKIIFVIDVQDIKRYDLALKYLENIVYKLKQEDTKLEFSIFLHKYDPNISKQGKFKEINKKINLELINKINSIMPKEIRYNIFKTTIYTVFEKTLA